MSRNLDDLLDYEAHRRPTLAALVAKLDHLTEAEIAAADVPLSWMRKALLARKRDRERAHLAASLDQSLIIAGHLPDPVGEMRRWEIGDTFIRVGRGQLEICYGQLIWLDTGAVWIDTIRSPMIDPLLFHHTVSCGHVSRSAYMAAVRARARQLVPSETAATPMERVRFYRPG